MSEIPPYRARVLIIHERFLFRFGADRVFMLIAEQLKTSGCHVTMLAARYDREALEACSHAIVTLPMPATYGRSDEFCSRWLTETFLPKARAQGGYDLIIHGGWPLFGATRIMRQLAPKVMFLDHGVVPVDGYQASTQDVLRHVQHLRVQHLPDCTHAAGVSRFIVETQTIRDVGPHVPVRVLLNGADHLAPSTQINGRNHATVTRVNQLADQGHPLILNLGRFEWGTYKNSHVAAEIFQMIRSAIPAARLLILESSENLRLPDSLSSGVEPIGFPDDDALAQIIRLTRLGISTSLWEGYNLPLVELLRNGTPALAFRIGAHTEVVPHPWFLCANREQMTARAVSILEDSEPSHRILASSSSQTHWQHLTWSRFMAEMVEFLDFSTATATTSVP